MRKILTRTYEDDSPCHFQLRFYSLRADCCAVCCDCGKKCVSGYSSDDRVSVAKATQQWYQPSCSPKGILLAAVSLSLLPHMDRGASLERYSCLHSTILCIATRTIPLPLLPSSKVYTCRMCKLVNP